jgi:hypothetical protein
MKTMVPPRIRAPNTTNADKNLITSFRFREKDDDIENLTLLGFLHYSTEKARFQPVKYARRNNKSTMNTRLFAVILSQLSLSFIIRRKRS